MPTPIKPSSRSNWTIGNPNFGTVTVEPTSGKKITGWTPSEKPPAETWNWLLYNQDQWSKYLEDITDLLKTEYDTLVSSLTTNVFVHEVPAGAVNGTNQVFNTTFSAVSQDAVWITVGGLPVAKADFTWAGTVITLATAPQVGEAVDVQYVRIAGVSIGGGGGGGGSQAFVPYGSIASPNVVSAGVGVPVLTSDRQMVFVRSTAGAVPITANPQVAPAVGVGQELIIIGTSDTNYISLADGNGLALNGGIDLKSNRTITLVWTGSVWLENGRR